MKNLRKNSAGITLVALVITIIILIILASISIGAISGEHGIIKQAKEAKNLHEDAVSKEEKDIQELVNEYEKSLEENFTPSGKIGIEASIENPKSEYKAGETIYYTITISNNINTKIEDVCVEVIASVGTVYINITDAGANSQITDNKVMIDFLGQGEKRIIQCEYTVPSGYDGGSITLQAEVSASPIIYGEENKTFEIETVKSEVTIINVPMQVPQSHYTLTIYYVYENGETAAEYFQRENLLEGDSYSVNSPVVDGYTPDQVVCSGKMPARNVALTVVYTAEVDTSDSELISP